MAPPMSPEQRKAANRKKAADLRARLLASQQAGAGPPATATTLLKSASPRLLGTEDQSKQDLPSHDLFSLENMKAAAKATAAAQAKVAAQERLLRKDFDGTADFPDLKFWLELTGYHNVDYRNARVAAYERQQLEERAADMSERIHRLQQGEPAVDNPAMSTADVFCPKAYVAFPSPRHGQGTQLQIPAATAPAFKRAEPPRLKRPRSQSSPSDRDVGQGDRKPVPPLGRRISYPDRRARPPDRRGVHAHGDSRQHRLRDASLERRQQYYTFPHAHDLYRPHREDYSSRPAPTRQQPQGHFRFSTGTDQYGHERESI